MSVSGYYVGFSINGDDNAPYDTYFWPSHTPFTTVLSQQRIRERESSHQRANDSVPAPATKDIKDFACFVKNYFRVMDWHTPEHVRAELQAYKKPPLKGLPAINCFDKSEIPLPTGLPEFPDWAYENMMYFTEIPTDASFMKLLQSEIIVDLSSSYGPDFSAGSTGKTIWATYCQATDLVWVIIDCYISDRSVMLNQKPKSVHLFRQVVDAKTYAREYECMKCFVSKPTCQTTKLEYKCPLITFQDGGSRETLKFTNLDDVMWFDTDDLEEMWDVEETQTMWEFDYDQVKRVLQEGGYEKKVEAVPSIEMDE